MKAALLALFLFPLTALAFPAKDSQEFTHKFTGSEIWDGAFLNNWSELNGGGAVKSLDGSILNYDHSASTSATTLDGSASDWSTGCSADWTCEIKIRFNAIPNGFALWIGAGANRIVVEAYADRTQDSGANSFSATNNNTDGIFHRYRITHDSTNSLYYVWRDGELLTPSGAPYDSTSNDNRLLFGDYTSGTFGDFYNVDIAWIRYDQSGSYEPPAEPSPADLYAWYRGDDGIIQSGSTVSTWINQATSTNAANRHLSRVEGSPLSIELLTNDGRRGAVRFDGTDALWSGAGDFGTLDSAKTLIFALRLSDSEDGFLFDGTTNTGMTRSQVREGNWQVGIQSPPISNAASTDPITGPITTNQWQVHSFTFNEIATGTEIAHYQSGTPLNTSTNSNTDPLSGLILGMNASASMGLNVDIGEVLVYNSLISTNERSAAESYLSNKWSGATDPTMQFIGCTTTQSPRKIAPFGLHDVIGIVIESEDLDNPLILTNIVINANETTAKNDIQSVRVYATGNTPVFSAENLFAEYTGSMTGAIELSGQLTLTSGDNHLWICYTLKEPAPIGHRVDAQCLRIYLQGHGSEIPNVTSPPGALTIASIPHKLVLRQRGDEGVNTYRIPGLATATNGAVIAVFDLRHNSSGDLPGNIDVGMRRSLDNGSTWEPMQTIMDMGDDPAWNYDGVGDPCILVDDVNGWLWVGALWCHGNNSWWGSGPGLTPEETGQFVLAYSDDNGISWSEPFSITPQIKDPAWNLCFQGPGNGFTSRDGNLVMPAQYKDSSGVARSCFITSSDRGSSWNISNPAVPSGSPATTESQTVELNNGDYMISMRNHAGLGKRAWATTSDEGTSWSAVSYANPDPTCQASFIRYSSTLDDAPENILLFANPGSSSRVDMTIRMSRDEGQSWSISRLLDTRYSAYSCMSVLQDGTVGILYETGDTSAYNTLTFARFTIDWLTRGPTTRLQYGFDYTNEAVADYDSGIINDDSNSDYPGMVLFHIPSYSPDVPPIPLTKFCTGIGSLDVRGDHHAIESLDSNIMMIEDLENSGGLTLEVWAKQTSTREYGTILSLGDSVSIVSQTTGTDSYRIVLDDVSTSAPTFPISDAEKAAAGWTHLAAVIRDYTGGASPSGTAELWINGKLKDSVPITTAPDLNRGITAGMGSRTDSTSGIWRWDGLIYEPRITARALTPEEFTYRRVGTTLLVK